MATKKYNYKGEQIGRIRDPNCEVSNSLVDKYRTIWRTSIGFSPQEKELYDKLLDKLHTEGSTFKEWLIDEIIETLKE